MPIKLTEHVPPPVPQPSSTYGIEGLSSQEMMYLRMNLEAGFSVRLRDKLSTYPDSTEVDVMRRILSVIRVKGF